MSKKIYGICSECSRTVIVTPSATTNLDDVYCPNCHKKVSIETGMSDGIKQKYEDILDKVGYRKYLGLLSDLDDEDRDELGYYLDKIERESLAIKEDIAIREIMKSVGWTNIYCDGSESTTEVIYESDTGHICYKYQLVDTNSRWWKNYKYITRVELV